MCHKVGCSSTMAGEREREGERFLTECDWKECVRAGRVGPRECTCACESVYLWERKRERERESCEQESKFLGIWLRSILSVSHRAKAVGLIMTGLCEGRDSIRSRDGRPPEQPLLLFLFPLNNNRVGDRPQTTRQQKKISIKMVERCDDKRKTKKDLFLTELLQRDTKKNKRRLLWK